jgi:IS4 transposase
LTRCPLRVEKSFEEKLEENKGKVSVKNFEDNVFYAFVELYKKRWTIEECFKELKSYLSFDEVPLEGKNFRFNLMMQ